jgi:hypothetical protein
MLVELQRAFAVSLVVLFAEILGHVLILAAKDFAIVCVSAVPVVFVDHADEYQWAYG